MDSNGAVMRELQELQDRVQYILYKRASCGKDLKPVTEIVAEIELLKKEIEVIHHRHKDDGHEVAKKIFWLNRRLGEE